MNFAVVGAGVVGLTTALELQKEFRDAKVTIIADKFGEDTTSYVAAGIFRPGLSFVGPTPYLTKKWVKTSYSYWENIRANSVSAISGVTSLSGYYFSNIGREKTRNSLIEDIVPKYRDVTPEELSLYPGNWKYGSYFQTLLIDNTLFLTYATQKFQSQNGVFLKKQLNSFNDIDDNFDIIINCSGLGAQKLCNDNKMVPIRGQVLKVEAPQIKTAVYGDSDTYIIPGINSVTLGGTRNYESYDTEISKYDTMSIFDRCSKLIPTLKNSKLIKECVGLRPYRPQVRVEIDFDFIDAAGKNLLIVHNYGHGAYGVTTSPGTAIYAVYLTKQILSASSLKNHL